MANKTISQFSSDTNLTGNELFLIMDNGITKNAVLNNVKNFVLSGQTFTGGTSYYEVTYSELVDKITGETLNTGSYYMITDFRSCYDQPDFNRAGTAITTGNYKQAAIEPIMVFATSANTISTTAYQPAYPNDRIQYDWTFNQTERTQGDAVGRITERIDEDNNRTDYDHRTILFKRYRYYELQLNNPYQGTVEVINISGTVMTVSGTGTNFLSSVSVGNKVGFEPNNNDYRVYEVTSVDSNSGMTITGSSIVNLSPNTKMYPADWDEYSSYYQNNVDDPSVFEEYYTFYGTDNFNNYIGNHANLYDWQENEFILANNVFHNRFIGNKFGDNCYNNTFFDDCENNNIGNFFYNNITDDDFDGNVIGNQFYNNRITSNFQYNRIGENFYNNYIVQNSFYRNNIMNDFRDNEISGGDFQNNEIGSQFNQNKIKEQFYKNDIGNGFNLNNIYWGAAGNLIGNGFNQNDIYCGFYDNVIGEYFYNNTLGDILNLWSKQFYENRISTRFESNTITDNFYRNDIGHFFNNNEISGETYTNRIGEQFETNTIYGPFYDNQIFNEFKGNITYQDFGANKVDWGFGGNHFSGYCSGNSFGPAIDSNDFLGSVYGNIFKGEVFGNTIGGGFANNNIGFGFGGNIIGENFGYGASAPQGNIIGNNFIDNTIGEYFYNNYIPDNFYENEIGNYFQWNVINTNIDRTYFTLNYGNITGFSYTASGTGATDTVYTNLTGTTNGHGVSATFDVEVSGGTVTGVSGNTEGRLYLNGNTLTILGSQIGGVTDEISGFTLNSLRVKIYKPADSTYEFPDNETEMDYLIENSPLFDTYYSTNIQGVSYSIKTGTDQNEYGMVIEGYIQIPSGNTYYFGLSSDDGSDAFINGVKVADWYGGHGDNGNVPDGNQYPISLTAGTYPIKVRLQEISGQDIVSLLYSSDSGSTWNIIPDNWFTFGATGTTGSYPNIVAQGTGSGENATFDVTVVDGLVDSVVLSNGGGFYQVGEILTISGSEFGGTEDITITVDSVYSDDIVITVTGVTSGSLFYEHYTKQIFERKGGNKRVSFYDEEDILNVDSIYTASGYIPVYSQVISFPLNNASFEFQCDGSYTNNASYTGNEVNNAQELVTLFNNNFRQFGYFFDNNDGTIGLYINPSLKQQYCPSGTYTIEVFND